jgi:hypothetical protein
MYLAWVFQISNTQTQSSTWSFCQNTVLVIIICIIAPQPRHVLLCADKSQVAATIEGLKARAIQKRLDEGYIFGKVEDPQLGEGSSAMTFMLQQLGVVRLAREAVLDIQDDVSD